MSKREPPVIDMRIDGSFPPPRGAPLPARIASAAVVIAVIAGGLVLVSLIMWLLLWAVAILLPVALVAGLIAWGAYKYQAWKGGGSFRGPRDVFRS